MEVLPLIRRKISGQTGGNQSRIVDLIFCMNIEKRVRWGHALELATTVLGF